MRSWLAVLLLLVCGASFAQPIPHACEQYRREVTRSAWRVHGPDAPVALSMAQIHAESACKSDAVSFVGAQGLAQFMPPTAADMARNFSECSPADPFNAGWSIRCKDLYMRQLLRSTKPYAAGLDACSQWVFALRAYNGGGGWVNRDRRKARDAGVNPDNWVEVQPFNAGRRASAFHENTEYPLRILKIQLRYIAAGWGAGVCQSG